MDKMKMLNTVQDPGADDAICKFAFTAIAGRKASATDDQKNALLLAVALRDFSNLLPGLSAINLVGFLQLIKLRAQPVWEDDNKRSAWIIDAIGNLDSPVPLATKKQNTLTIVTLSIIAPQA